MFVPVFDERYFTVFCFSGLSYEELRNRQNYPTGVNNGPMQLAMFGEVFVAIFNYFSWTSISLLLDTGAMAPFFKLWPDALINLANRVDGHFIKLERQRFNSSSTIPYDDLLRQARKVSRGKSSMRFL